MNAPRKVTPEEAAVEQLIRYGRQSYKRGADVLRAEAMGTALFLHFLPREAVLMAATIASENNHHELAAKLRRLV
jgi:hypothetical protein